MVFERKILTHGDPEDEVAENIYLCLFSRFLKCVLGYRSYETLCSNC